MLPAGHPVRTEPTGHFSFPVRQSEHDGAVEVCEYLPAAHSMHATAPMPVPVSVIEPAAQSLHESTFDAAEYWPGAHAAQVVAPAFGPVLVTDPGGHAMQEVEPGAGWW